MVGKHHNSSKMSTKKSVIVNVHVGKSSKKKVKRKRMAKNDLSQMIVRPIYQSIMAPQPMPTHHNVYTSASAWPPNVSVSFRHPIMRKREVTYFAYKP